MKHNFKSVLFPIFIPIRRSIYISLYAFDRVLRRKNKLLILCYHGVSNDSWRFSVNPEIAKKQLQYIIKNYDLVTIEEVEKIINGKMKVSKPSALITFDDGYKDILVLRDFIREKGIKPALFVLSKRENPNIKEMDTNRSLLTPEEIMDLKQDGWTIGNHSATHADFWSMSEKKMKDEITNSKITLEKEFDSSIVYFAYPKGRYTKSVLSEVKKAGYNLAFSMNDAFIDARTDPFLVPRIGVDRTHSFIEFQSIFSPSVILFRSLIKQKLKLFI